MNRKGVEFTVSQVDEDWWNWRFQIGETVRTGNTQTRLMGMAAHRVQQKIDRELKEAQGPDLQVDRQTGILPIKTPALIGGFNLSQRNSPSAGLAHWDCQGWGGFCRMPARSILSKHIPHVAAWSVSTAFLNYLGSRRRADGVGPKRAARLILQSRLNRTEVIE